MSTPRSPLPRFLTRLLCPLTAGALVGLLLASTAQAQVGDLRKLKMRGLATVSGWVAWNMATFNLVRLGGMAGWWNPSPT